MKLNLAFLFFFVVCYSHAQRQNIDVDLLSDIVAAKQEELKTRVLSNIVVKNIKTTNYTTYNTIYNLVDIITTEKNKTVMTQGIIHQMANYAIVFGLTNYYVTKNLYQRKSDQFLKLDHEIRGEESAHSKLKSITDLMSSAYTTEATTVEQEETKTTSKTNDEIKWNDLLANYLIDTAYQILSENKTLRDRGFFKKDPLRNFFSTGLDIDYSGVRKHFTREKVKLLEEFVQFLNRCTSIVDSTDVIIGFVSNNRNQIKDLGKTKNR